MKRVRLGSAAAVLVLVFAAIGACSDRTTTGDLLLGTWQLSAYDDHGDSAATTGTWSFFRDASFSVLGTITYPGEPTDSLDVIGTWREQGETSITMTVAGETTLWDLELAPDTAVLLLPDADGAVRITLTR